MTLPSFPEPGSLAGLDVQAESARLESASAEERLAFAVERFGEDLLFTSSFGAGSGVLLHLWSRVARHLPVVFIDTGFLFDETLKYKDELAAKLGLRIETIRPPVAREPFLAQHGDDIMRRDPDFCCKHNKIDPLAPLRAKAKAWVSGLRRDQSATRADTPVLAREADGVIKVYPIVSWTAADAERYLREHDVPEHPLKARRYLSIGCEPCTRPVEEGEDERAGRWAGTGKTECGLHSPAREAYLKARAAQRQTP